MGFSVQNLENKESIKGNIVTRMDSRLVSTVVIIVIVGVILWKRPHLQLKLQSAPTNSGDEIYYRGRLPAEDPTFYNYRKM